jgi:hypothetical protein
MTSEQMQEYKALRAELHDYCIVNERRGKGCKGCLLEKEAACGEHNPRLSSIKKAVELIRKERAANAV